jgi:hypothetical protein
MMSASLSLPADFSPGSHNAVVLQVRSLNPNFVDNIQERLRPKLLETGYASEEC